MPVVKTRREDVLRNPEIDAMLSQAEKGTAHYHSIKGWTPDEFGFGTIKFKPNMVQCLIALLWLFGKRITENLKLKRKDVWIGEGYLYVHFYVLKKKTRESEPIPYRKLKRITLENPYVKHVLEYAGIVIESEAYLFPSQRSRTGYMSRQHAYRILKGLNPDAWIHLFRHSLATEMAERGATEEELKAWFDWDRSETAHRYVKGGPKLTEKWSRRTF